MSKEVFYIFSHTQNNNKNNVNQTNTKNAGINEYMFKPFKHFSTVFLFFFIVNNVSRALNVARLMPNLKNE